MNIKENNPLVTVLICAYNSEKYIEDCLNAIIKQTYYHLDILVINDGSTDNTLTILDKISRRDERIRIENNETNLGFITSLNKGLALAKGKYIAKTDSDDITEPQWIEKIINEMEKRPDILAMGCDMKILSEENNGSILALTASHGEIWEKPREHQEIIKAMLFYSPINNPTAIMRTDIYQKYGLSFNSNYLHAEDYKFWLEVSRLGKLANYPEALVNYRLHQNQVSSLHHIKQQETAQKIRKEAISYYLQDLGITTSFSNKIYFNDIYHIHQSQIKFETLPMEILKEILFITYMSLDEYHLKDLIRFLSIKENNILSFKQKRKIVKRFLFPKRYKSIL